MPSRAIVTLLAIALGSTGALAERHSYAIVSTGMEPTLSLGAVVQAEVFSGTPKVAVGDIVVVRQESEHDALTFKRIVGVAGDRLEIKDKILYRNGQAVPEPYVVHRDQRVIPLSTDSPRVYRYRDQLPALTVPRDTVYVLGDNRDNSYDSRNFGPVPLSALVARLVNQVAGGPWPSNSLQGTRHAHLWLAALGAIVLARP
jgi:signal peptidase I